MDVGKGKKVKNELTKIESHSNINRDTVYGVFMPAYRAIKERFDKRSIFQWIFNHEQYVAERDSIKALSAIMTTLTGDTMEQLDAALKENQNVMPSSDKEKLERFLDTGVHPDKQNKVDVGGREAIQVMEADQSAVATETQPRVNLNDKIHDLLDDSIDDDNVPELKDFEESYTSL